MKRFIIFKILYLIYEKKSSEKLFIGGNVMKFKKLISMLLIVFIIPLFLIGCSKANTEKNLIEDFLHAFYDIEDYTKVDLNETIDKFPNDQYTLRYKELLSDDAFKATTSDRANYVYIRHLIVNKTNSKFVELKEFKKSDTDKVYNFKAIINLNNVEKNTKDDVELIGQVTIDKIGNKLIISQINKLTDVDLYSKLPIRP